MNLLKEGKAPKMNIFQQEVMVKHLEKYWKIFSGKEFRNTAAVEMHFQVWKKLVDALNPYEDNGIPRNIDQWKKVYKKAL